MLLNLKCTQFEILNWDIFVEFSFYRGITSKVLFCICRLICGVHPFVALPVLYLPFIHIHSETTPSRSSYARGIALHRTAPHRDFSTSSIPAPHFFTNQLDYHRNHQQLLEHLIRSRRCSCRLHWILSLPSGFQLLSGDILFYEPVTVVCCRNWPLVAESGTVEDERRRRF